MVHELADELHLDHDSFGTVGVDRYIRVTKVDPEVLRERQAKQAGLNVAYQTYLTNIQEARARTSPPVRHLIDCITTPKKQAGELRHLQWNIEWMDYFYGDDGSFLQSNRSAEITNVPELCQRIATAIKDLDPDVISVEEGPSTLAKMKLFVDSFLGGQYVVIGGLENLTQQLFLLIRKNGPVTHPEIHAPSLQFLTKSWFYDVDGDRALHEYKFTRRPLVVNATLQGKPVFFIVVHLKSKFVARGRSMWLSERPEEVEHFVNKAIANRRRIQAESFRLRQCIADVIGLEEATIVSGDFNDGPGCGFFEEFYGLINILDALLGSEFYGTKTLHHVLPPPSDSVFTCEFDDYVDNIPNKRVLLDHVFVSKSLKGRVRSCIAHDVFQKSLEGGGRDRQSRASDHRPVVSDIQLLIADPA